MIVGKVSFRPTHFPGRKVYPSAKGWVMGPHVPSSKAGIYSGLQFGWGNSDFPLCHLIISSAAFHRPDTPPPLPGASTWSEVHHHMGLVEPSSQEVTPWRSLYSGITPGCREILARKATHLPKSQPLPPQPELRAE